MPLWSLPNPTESSPAAVVGHGLVVDDRETSLRVFQSPVVPNNENSGVSSELLK